MTPNEPNGLVFVYYLKEDAREPVEIIVEDHEGREVRRLNGVGKAGINRLVWNFTDAQGRIVPPGVFRVTLRVGPWTLSQEARVLAGLGHEASGETAKGAS